MFDPQYECLIASLNKINNWIYINAKDFEVMFKIKDINILKSYLFLFLITHEIEHSYQYLMGKGIINAPSQIIQYGYKRIFDLFLKNESIIPSPIKETRNLISLILYKRNENLFVLERNENIESTDLLCQLALFTGREDIFEMFNEMKTAFMSIGYTEGPIGSLEETYRKFFLYDRYKRFYENPNMTEEEKAEYGLNISEQTRQRILEKIRKK